MMKRTWIFKYRFFREGILGWKILIPDWLFTTFECNGENNI